MDDAKEARDDAKEAQTAVLDADEASAADRAAARAAVADAETAVRKAERSHTNAMTAHMEAMTAAGAETIPDTTTVISSDSALTSPGASASTAATYAQTKADDATTAANNADAGTGGDGDADTDLASAKAAAARAKAQATTARNEADKAEDAAAAALAEKNKAFEAAADATAAAVNATSDDVAKKLADYNTAQADADADPNDGEKAVEARQAKRAYDAAVDAAADAVVAAAVYGDTMMAGDDDDDDTMAGDDDDDDDGMMMADMDMQVAPNGVGDLLIFGIWTTQEGRGTLVALTNTGSMMTNVHVRVREGMGSQDVGDFTVCLGAGDVWTAAIVSDGATSRLMVGNAGSCAGPSALPADGVIIGASFGYLEAFTVDAMYGGADSLAGTATIISVSDGFASSYNATALVGLDAMDTAAESGGHDVKYALAREGGVDKEMLLGRWTAATSPAVSRTHIVLTFPGSGQPGKDDLITALIYNEDGQSNNSPRSLMLGQEVNICTFWNKMDTEINRVAFECNGGNKLLVDFEGGWFKLVNNAGGMEMDNVDAMPAKRFAAIGLQFSTFMGENGAFDQSYPIQWMAYSGAGGMGAAPWSYMMDDGMMMMINPGDNMTGSVEMMGMDDSDM